MSVLIALNSNSGNGGVSDDVTDLPQRIPGAATVAAPEFAWNSHAPLRL